MPIRIKRQRLALENHCKTGSTAAENIEFVNFSARTPRHISFAIAKISRRVQQFAKKRYLNDEHHIPFLVFKKFPCQQKRGDFGRH